MRKRALGKKIFCLMTAATLLFTTVVPTSAASARATTMKLSKKEGTVTLKTQSGTALRITEGMRLYNGNTISTASNSYAFVSLDSDKAVKLDESSSATLRQSGSSLELLVKSGQLFFNVSKPLEKKESMNVRTSTMVTGIRGTCGVVEVVSKTVSKLYLIEGEITLGSGANAVTVRGGQTATVVLDTKKEQTSDSGDAKHDAKQTVLVDKLTETEIPFVALEEIVNDTALQEKIERTTDLEVEKIEETYEELTKEDTPAGGSASSDNSSSDNSSSGSSSVTPAVTSATLSGAVTAGAINDALARYDLVKVNSETDENGKILGITLAGETVTIDSGKTLQLIGTHEIAGNVSGSGTLVIGQSSGSVSSLRSAAAADTEVTIARGYYVMTQTLQIKNATVNNNGSIHVDKLTLSGAKLDINSGTQVDAAAFAASSGSEITNDGGVLNVTSATADTSSTYSDCGTGIIITPGSGSASVLGVTKLATMNIADGEALSTIYAPSMNTKAIEWMSGEKYKEGVVQKICYTFYKDALISTGTASSPIEWDLAAADVQLNGHEIQVADSCGLKLIDMGTISGTGNAILRLGASAGLVISSSNIDYELKYGITRVPQLAFKSSTDNTYAIAVDETAVQTVITAKVTIEDSFSITAPYTNLGDNHLIQNMVMAEDRGDSKKYSANCSYVNDNASWQIIYDNGTATLKTMDIS